MRRLKPVTRIFLFLLFCVNISATNGQIISLKGKIISVATKAGLTYAGVNIPAIGISTVSNDDGEFDLKFSENSSSKDSIIFTCIGFKSQTIGVAVALKQKYLLISLVESTVELKEVLIKPLPIKELLDSLSHRNHSAFNSPMKLSGYYREFAFTNSKCNEYSDALFDYYYDNSIKNGIQLKIDASRCEKAVKKNDDNQNFEAFMDSQANPDKMFGFAMLDEMLKKFFPDKQLPDYKYSIEGNETNKDLLITIYPKPGTDEFHKLQLFTSDDFMLRSYKLEIPDELLDNVKEKKLLGIHVKVTALSIEARYSANNSGIYPQYFKITKDIKLSGKFMGTIINQISSQKSEFAITQINTKNISPIPKNELYKKGNICDNGVAINIAQLKNYNFIQPTKKDSLAISSLTKNILPN